MERSFILGIFKDEHHLIDLALDMRKKNIPIHDIYTPFPVHGLDHAMGISRSRLPFITFIAGSLGLCLSLFFQYWVSVVDWPIIVGGKPHNSFPAFIPVSFEITILFGAFITVFAFLFGSRLFPGKKPLILDQDATSHHFVVAVEKKDWSIDTQVLRKYFLNAGAEKVIFKEIFDDTKKGNCCGCFSEKAEK